MITLYHVTTEKAYLGIHRQGILCEKARGKRRAVWLCREEMVCWAILHTAKRHATPLAEVLVIKVEVPAEQVRLHDDKLLYTYTDVPVSAFCGIKYAEEYS